jgi:hypothetical protein
MHLPPQEIRILPKPRAEDEIDDPSHPDYEPRTRDVHLITRTRTIVETLLVQSFCDDQSMTMSEFVANNEAFSIDVEETVVFRDVTSFKTNMRTDIAAALKDQRQKEYND